MASVSATTSSDRVETRFAELKASGKRALVPYITAGHPDIDRTTDLLRGLESAGGTRVCSKSVDGGATFTILGPLFSKPVPQHTECLPNGEVFGAVDNHYPQAAPDGSLYVLVRCGGSAPAAGDLEYLARSVDEGATWPIVHPVPQPATTANDLDQLRVDTAGNLYLLRTDPATFRPLLRTSTDGGASRASVSCWPKWSSRCTSGSRSKSTSGLASRTSTSCSANRWNACGCASSPW